MQEPRRLFEVPKVHLSRFENDIQCMDSHSNVCLVGTGCGGVFVLKGASNPVRAVNTHAHLLGTHCVGLFPSGKVAFSGGADFVGRIWDLEEDDESDPEPAAELKGHTKGLLSVCFIGRGRTLCTGGRDKAIVWDVSTQSAVSTACSDGPVWSLAKQEDQDNNTIIICGRNDFISLYDIRTPTSSLFIFQLSLPSSASSSASSLVFSSPIICVGTSNGEIIHYDWRQSQKPLHCSTPRGDAPITSLWSDSANNRIWASNSLGQVWTEGQEVKCADYGEAVVGGRMWDDESRLVLVTKERIILP